MTATHSDDGQSLGEIVALARVVGLELEVDQIRERIHQLDRSCPHWPWSGQSQRVLQSFLNDISSLAAPRSSP